MTRKSTLEMELGRREEGDIERPASIILLLGLVGVFQPCYTHMMNGRLRHCMILNGVLYFGFSERQRHDQYP